MRDVISSRDTIIWRVHFRSGPQRIYELLATDRGRAQFWAESAVETDGVIHFQFVNGVETQSRIIQRDPPATFVIEYFGSRVTFTLEPDGRGGTDLTMTNTEFDADDYLDILPGWLNVLFPLKAAADFGVDLRNHDPDRTWDRGYIDQ